MSVHDRFFMTRHKQTAKGTTIQAVLTKVSGARGVFAEVARQLDLSLTHVRLVALGKRVGSARIEHAILKELKKRGLQP